MLRLKKIILIMAACLIIYNIMEKQDVPLSYHHTIPILNTDFKQEILVTGKLEAKENVDVGAQVSGQLKSIAVSIGENVKQNQLLAVIDPAQAENQIKAQEATLAGLYAQRRQAEVTLERSQGKFSRQQQLFKTQSVSRQDFEDALTDVRLGKEQIKAVDAQIQNQKALNATATTSLSYTRITSPIDGQVTAIKAAEGQTLVATQMAPTLMTVSNLNTMLVRSQVSEADIIRLKTGVKAWFTVLGDTETRHEGVLKTIMPTPEAVNGATFYDVLFEVPNLHGTLRLGMTAQIHIELKKDTNVLTIPLNALGESDGNKGYRVRLLRKGKTVESHVIIGARNDVQGEVISGVRAGDEVIVDSDAGNE